MLLAVNENAVPIISAIEDAVFAELSVLMALVFGRAIVHTC